MRDVALFIKSYRRDLPLVERLLGSLARHNRDGLASFISVPAEDVEAFQPLISRFTDVNVVSDAYFDVPPINEKIWQKAPGYITQQLLKLSVHHLEEAHNYVILDSDTYFIRDFRASDFVTPDGIGITVNSADNDLTADPAYTKFSEGRNEKIRLIAERLEVPELMRATCHNNTVFQTVVLQGFDVWRESEGLSLGDLMKIAPMEFTWYAFFLQQNYPDRLVRVEPFIKMLHTRSEFRRLTKAGFTHDGLQKAYLGVCLNSGWAGTAQSRYVSRLERGSRLARAMLLSDRVRYNAAHEFQLFFDARLERPLSRLSDLRRAKS